MSRFIDPTTDFGFKKLFGDEANKDITMGFLTDVLEPPTPLVDISFLDKEQLPATVEGRAGVYDLFCRDVAGNHFIVEMQKSRVAFLKERLLYYATFPIAAQAWKGKLAYYDPPFMGPKYVRETATATYGRREAVAPVWDYSLSPIFCIAVLDYVLDGSKNAVNRSSLRYEDSSCEPYYEKLRFITLELPLFDEQKVGYDPERRINKWLFFLNYLAELDHIPARFQHDEIFLKAFRVAELANLTRADRWQYELSLKRVRDLEAALHTSYTRGKNEGKNEGKIEEGRAMLHLLFSQKLGALPEDIAVTIHAIDNIEPIRQIMANFIKINDWEALREYLPLPSNGNSAAFAH